VEREQGNRNSGDVPEDVARLKELVLRLREDYADDPNIKAIGWGSPRRAGELADELAVVFFVARKEASDRVITELGSTRIPAEIEGFATDVQDPVLRPAWMGQRDEQKYDPLRGGIATSNAEGHIVWFNGAGTLGILARDNATGSAVGLSNWHVWGDGGSTGDQIIQPGHPTGGDHAEAVGKVLACGPLVTSLIEWEAPDPIAVGLYGGAAALAIAAAASDYRDPTRRGQDVTVPEPGSTTLWEQVDVAIEYPQLPLPGVPFQTDVTWDYARHTDTGVLTHSVTETRSNTQFLLGQLVVTDKPTYAAGDLVRLTAAIWDWQDRACDAYHVVAHLIPERDPNTAYRAVLAPTACPRQIPQDPPGDGQDTLCLDFDDFQAGEYPPSGTFAWLGYMSTDRSPVRLVDWFEPDRGLQIPPKPLGLRHAPAMRVVARIVQFASSPVSLFALNAAGDQVDQATTPAGQGTVHEVELNGSGIVEVVLRGGDGEALLIDYCIDPVGNEPVEIRVRARVAEAVHAEHPGLDLSSRQLKAHRCCFTGSLRLPPDEPAGKWAVHLSVQNVNDVPDGTKPEEAATVIGGHLLSVHADALGCAAIMLLDHAFDVI
jgi:hypothetical protein